MATYTSSCLAADLSAESIRGDWLFTHIIMDGEREMKVNKKTQFLPDGTAVYYDSAGNESARGTYVVQGDSIIYTDEKGEQKWKLVSFDGDSLHVDHRGAEMFFKRL
jgi:hypothetical protein